ncbi:MAG: OmpA family protein [Thermodesulfobacteriota bacterium]|nr:OmpA family protein [Thermodesulfobacteriota bacterium]
MKTIKVMILTSLAGLLFSCATAPVPMELSNARQAYQQASTGPAAELAPVQLHKAKLALDQAENAFAEAPESYRTRDFAYVAERRALQAEVFASIAFQKSGAIGANKEYETTQGEIIARAKEGAARAEKRKIEAAAAKAADKLTAEQQARIDAEKRAALAQENLAKVVALKEEARGLVITLSGSVVFASNQAKLLPAAKSRLDQVADALMSTDERRSLIVEGHTDAMGLSAYNLQLSQRRADAVRSYLISRGYPAGLIETQGIGEARPIADNSSAEGRSNNRRVEIIVQREAEPQQMQSNLGGQE